MSLRRTLALAICLAAIGTFAVAGSAVAAAPGFSGYDSAAAAQYTTGGGGGAVQGTNGGGAVQGTNGAGNTGEVAGDTGEGNQLPFTGLNVATILVIGLALFALGTALRASDRLLRRR